MPTVSAPRLTADQLNFLKDEHKALARKFIWQSDPETWSKPEYWDRPLPSPDGKLRGDCDDWAIEMDYRIREVIDRPHRKLAALKTQKGLKAQDHLVLCVLDGSKIWVSDCNQRTLVQKFQLPYHDWIWALDRIDREWVPV